MSAQEIADDMHGVVERRLRLIDQRYTSGRRAIVDLLVSAGHPVSIGDIAERLPGLPRSSAYRHLTDLHAAGLVRRVTASDEFTRFELAEDLTEHHHHLLCVNCGKVIDVTLPAAFEQQAAEAIGQLADAEGFQAHSHRLDVLGLCAACRLVRAPAAPANFLPVLRYPG
jgi:Fur family transcriptional regulator, ferric uptake regulator